LFSDLLHSREYHIKEYIDSVRTLGSGDVTDDIGKDSGDDSEVDMEFTLEISADAAESDSSDEEEGEIQQAFLEYTSRSRRRF
jgi:hypothetical protein